jgi:hypothetical protein
LLVNNFKVIAEMVNIHNKRCKKMALGNKIA